MVGGILTFEALGQRLSDARAARDGSNALGLISGVRHRLGALFALVFSLQGFSTSQSSVQATKLAPKQLFARNDELLLSKIVVKSQGMRTVEAAFNISSKKPQIA